MNTKRQVYRRRWALALLGIALSSMAIIAGCGAQKRQPTLLLLLFDETTSFAQTGHWEDSLRIAGLAVDQLKPGDAVGVIGIDHHGFDESDVRLPVTDLPRVALRAVEVKRDIKTHVSKLVPRETSSGYRLPDGALLGKPFGTDTMGALDHAAQIASYFKEARIRIVVFSDFRNEPITGQTGASGQTAIAGDCRLMAVYVEETGGGEWKERVGHWQQALTDMGMRCDTGDFYTPALSAPARQAQVMRTFLK